MRSSYDYISLDLSVGPAAGSAKFGKRINTSEFGTDDWLLGPRLMTPGARDAPPELQSPGTPSEWLPYYDVTVGSQAAGGQSDAKTIGLANGNYLVAWVEGANGTVGTTPGADVIGKIYDAEGNVVRDAYRLNTARSSLDEADYDIVATGDGGFVIAYVSSETNDEDNGSHLYWERYDAAGTSIDDALVGNLDGDDDYYGVEIAFDRNSGTSVLTYSETEGGDFHDDSVKGNTVSANGIVGTDFVVGEGDEIVGYNRVNNDDLIILENGNFVALFSEKDSDIRQTEARIFNSQGQSIANFNVANGLEDVEAEGAALANGNWVAAWIEHNDSGSFYQVRFRIFDPAGNALTASTVVSTHNSRLSSVDVVALADGGFVISWGRDQPGAVDDTIAHRFEADGTSDGAFFLVSPNHSGGGSTLTADGRIVFANTPGPGGQGDVHASIWDPRELFIIDAAFPENSRNFFNPFNYTTLLTSTFVIADQFANMILCRDGNDTVAADDGNDTILGRGGDDLLDGSFGADSIDGGTGNDTIIGGQGSDFLNGGADRDTVSYELSNAAVNVVINGTSNSGGHADGDFLFGFEILVGSNFNDTLSGGGTSSASSAIHGGGGNDSITGSGSSTTGGGNDTLFGDAGADTIFGSFGADVINGGADGDSLNGGAGNDTIRGGGGADIISGGTGTFGLFGAGGNDILFGEGGADTISGSTGNDILIGGAGADVLDGGTGIDTADYRDSSSGLRVSLQDPSGNTGIAIGDSYSGIENLAGSAFNDTLRGDAAGNRLSGAAGRDMLSGRAGDDTLAGGAGADTLDGGEGSDTADYSDSAVGLLVDLQKTAFNTGSAAGDRYIGIENLAGSSFNDTLRGNASDNRLDGGDGNDVLNGRGGDDTIVGGSGMDRLQGSGGADRFVFDDGDSSSFFGFSDHVTDFSHTEGDQIDLSAIDAIAGGSDDGFVFIGTAAFTAAGQVRYEIVGDQTYIFANVDDILDDDFAVVLDTSVTLVGADFVL